MADLYASYSDLAAHETEGVSYVRRSVPVADATWSSIAIHGGGIEPGSGEVARAVGAGLMAHYEFAGIKSTGNTSLHVTSTNFDEPTCQAIVTSSLRCLSFHGYTGTAGVPETSLGGLDTATADRLRSALTRAGFLVIDAAQEISGNDPVNVANRTSIAAGVQLEMSHALRASFFPNGDLTRAMRDSGKRTATFGRYVAAMRSVFEGRAPVCQFARRQCWFAPPVQLHSWTFVPLAVPWPLASRQRPDCTAVIVPSELMFHCWSACPLQSQIAAGVPLPWPEAPRHLLP